MKVSIERRACAFRTDRLYVALFETIRETGSDALDARRCVAFGTYARVLRWILAALPACERGEVYLDESENAVVPERYLAAWRDALRRPHRLFTQPVFVNAEGHPWAVEELRAHGYAHQAAEVADGSDALLALHKDARVLDAIYGFREGEARATPWDVVGAWSPKPDLSLNVDGGSDDLAVIPRMRVLDIGDGRHYALGVAGYDAGAVGTRADLFARFCATVAYDCAATSPTGGARALAAFRAAFALPAGQLHGNYGLAIDHAALAAIPGRTHVRDLARHRHATLADGRMVFRLDTLRDAGAIGLAVGVPCRALSLVTPDVMAEASRRGCSVAA